MFTRLLIFIVATLIVAWLGTVAWAGNYQFVTFQFPPLEYATDDGKAGGIAVEIVTNVMQTLGHDVTITVYPWTRALKMVRTGNADAIFTAYKNADREKFLDFSRQVLFPQVVYFYKNRRSAVNFTGDLASVKSKRIGVVSTISYGANFDQYKSNFILDKAHRLEHNFQKLLLNRVDLVPSNVYVAEYTLQRMDLGNQIVRLPHKIESVPSYIAFSKFRNLENLRDQFDGQLAVMKSNGAYARIIGKYNIEFIDSK